MQRNGGENESGMFRGKYLIALTNYAADGTGSARVKPLRHSSGEISEASGFNSELHGGRHLLCILRLSRGLLNR